MVYVIEVMILKSTESELNFLNHVDSNFMIQSVNSSLLYYLRLLVPLRN